MKLIIPVLYKDKDLDFELDFSDAFKFTLGEDKYEDFMEYIDNRIEFETRRIDFEDTENPELVRAALAEMILDNEILEQEKQKQKEIDALEQKRAIRKERKKQKKLERRNK